MFFSFLWHCQGLECFYLGCIESLPGLLHVDMTISWLCLWIMSVVNPTLKFINSVLPVYLSFTAPPSHICTRFVICQVKYTRKPIQHTLCWVWIQGLYQLQYIHSTVDLLALSQFISPRNSCCSFWNTSDILVKIFEIAVVHDNGSLNCQCQFKITEPCS
jgi:hypothetical protein